MGNILIESSEVSVLTPKQTDDTHLFSIFRNPINSKNPVPIKNVSVFDVYTVIKSEKYKSRTEKLRLLPSADKPAYKQTAFDYATFSGLFTYRAVNGLSRHSGLICLDFDHVGSKQDINNLKKKIINLFCPALMFVSPSGDGIKVIFIIDITQGTHLEYFHALESFSLSELGFKIDSACKDVSRACFLCYDPAAYFNESSYILDRSFIDTFQPQKEIKQQVDVITNYSEIISRLKVWLDKKESFVKGNRNKYISQLVGAFNRYGISENIALNEALNYSHNDFTVKEIEATVKSIYNNSQWFNTAKFDINTPYNFDEPEPIQQEITPTPLLPIEGMPEFVQDFINEYCRVYNIPRDFIAGSVLLSTALAIGNKLELVTKYRNVPILWFSIIGHVSSGKTDPLRRCLEYFTQKDADTICTYLRDMSIYEAEMSKPKKERDENILKPECFQYILNDYTPEALALVHAINKRGLCIYR